jgi:hypothetical protein
MGTNSMVEFEYAKPITATPEKDEKSRKYIILKVTNEFIKELKTAQRTYIAFKEERDEKGNYIRFNPNDPTDKKEMIITKQIDAEIHEIWTMLNPS